ncbi:MAG: hypothetical protein LBF62_10170 [Tannerellaceae bacterium]|jgi:hypothetical protein|nr:hypothetical protein [Tannerellaceae bacterium]
MVQNDKEIRHISHELKGINSKLYLLVALSGMTAFAPLVTDMYLPALPALTDYFKTSVSMVQFTISTSMLGIAPIAAPVAGGVLLLFTNWKGIFLLLGLLGLPVHKRAKGSVYSSVRFVAPVFKNKPLRGYYSKADLSKKIRILPDGNNSESWIEDSEYYIQILN